MLLMSYMSKRSLWWKLRSMRSLSRFTRRGAGNAHLEAPPCESTASPPTACDDPESIYNLSALRSGLLSLREVPGLAEHVTRCETCQIVLAVIVKEMTRVESTATHAVPPAKPEQGAASSGKRPGSGASSNGAPS